MLHSFFGRPDKVHVHAHGNTEQEKEEGEKGGRCVLLLCCRIKEVAMEGFKDWNHMTLCEINCFFCGLGYNLAERLPHLG